MGRTNNEQTPYPLTSEEVDKRITKKSPGNYAYGSVLDDSFYVDYVGRADFDLNDRIKHGIGTYKYFKYSYAISAKEAYEKECRNYHDFGGKDILDNKYHPDRPDGTDYARKLLEMLNEIDREGQKTTRDIANDSVKDLAKYFLPILTTPQPYYPTSDFRYL